MGMYLLPEPQHASVFLTQCRLGMVSVHQVPYREVQRRLSTATRPDVASSVAVLAWDSSGRMVTPAWPPTTGTVMSTGSTPRISATNASARTTSSFVTPSSLSGLYVPASRCPTQCQGRAQKVEQGTCLIAQAVGARAGCPHAVLSLVLTVTIAEHRAAAARHRDEGGARLGHTESGVIIEVHTRGHDGCTSSSSALVVNERQSQARI